MLFLLCILNWFSVSAVFFFFKQKTAYEMRISDWSSDVCSSDLHLLAGRYRHTAEHHRCGRDPERGVGHGGGEPQQLLDRPGEQRRAPPERGELVGEIGRASCRERVCQYV